MFLIFTPLEESDMVSQVAE